MKVDRVFEGVVVVDDARRGASLATFQDEDFVAAEIRDEDVYVVAADGGSFRIENPDGILPFLRDGAIDVLCVNHYDPVSGAMTRQAVLEIPDAAPAPGRP